MLIPVPATRLPTPGAVVAPVPMNICPAPSAGASTIRPLFDHIRRLFERAVLEFVPPFAIGRTPEPTFPILRFVIRDPSRAGKRPRPSRTTTLLAALMSGSPARNPARMLSTMRAPVVALVLRIGFGYEPARSPPAGPDGGSVVGMVPGARSCAVIVLS